LTQSIFQNRTELIGNRSKIRSFHPYRVKCTACNIELITKSHVDVRDLAFCGRLPRPLCETFKQLLSSDQEVSDALFDG